MVVVRMILFIKILLDDFLAIIDVDSVRRRLGGSAQQIIVRVGWLGNRDGADGGGLAVHAGDGEAEAGVLGEPDEVTAGIEGDFRHLIEGDA